MGRRTRESEDEGTVHVQEAHKPGAQDAKAVLKVKPGGKVSFDDHPVSLRQLVRDHRRGQS